MTENKSTIQTAAGVPERERAVLVAVVRDSQELRQSEEYLDELEFLAETADITTVRRFSQRLPQPSSRIYVGPGKLEEIAAYCEEHAVDVAIFDDELTPAQTRNIERAMPCRILDRTRLILDIFLARAQTAYAKTQVQLAQYEYMLPRLAGLWTHLERQRGGTGTRGGAGEREIETDRRIVRNRISKLKEDLKKIDRQMAVQRSNRGQLVRVALVGYTNVGKSTLMNLIAKSEVFAENKLFATLDTTVRKVVFDNLPFLLSDTVGFIRKLPTELIESFKSTLDEVREADLLLHVVDVSGCEGRDPKADFEQINHELEGFSADLATRPQIVLGNKCDIATPEQVEEFKQFVEAKGLTFVPISAATRQGVDALPAMVYSRLKELPPVKVFEAEYVKPSLVDAPTRPFTVERTGAHEFTVDAPWLERILAGTNVEDYESLQYFQTQLGDSGILDELVRQNVEEDDTIKIGEYEFDYVY